MQMLSKWSQSAAIGDMDMETLRRNGHRIVDWMVEYLAGEKKYPVLAQVAPGEIRRSLEEQAPVEAETMESILADVDRLLMPGISHWNSPGFMGYFGLTGSGPSILAEMFDSVLNVTRMIWSTSPAATELEQVTLDWLRQMLGLPYPMFGMLHHNSAVLHALVMAREALPDLRIRQKGMAGRQSVPRLRVYASQEAHASVDKAAIVVGIGQEGLRKIGTDDEFRMDVTELEQAMREDIRLGWRPCAVVATVGTTSTTSIDPVASIADVCERYGLWLPVDAAYAGAAAIVPSKRWVLEGCERADTRTSNPHKWLFTSFGCSAFYTRWPDLLKSALSLTPDYLHDPRGQSDQITNLMDYDFVLPHRMPALKLWMVMRYFGQEGLIARIEEHCQLAQRLAHCIDATPHFERMAPTQLSVVCFRAHPLGMDDERQLEALNERIMQRVNSTGHYFLSHTRLHGKFTMRIAIGNIRTTESHVSGLWDEIQAGLRAEMNVVRRCWIVSQQGIVRMLGLPSREG